MVAADAGTEPRGTLLIGPTSSPDAASSATRPPGDRRSPRDAILRTWDDLAQALIETASRLGDRRNPGSSRVEPTLRFLVGRGYLEVSPSETSGREKSVRLTVQARDYLTAHLRKTARIVKNPPAKP